MSADRITLEKLRTTLRLIEGHSTGGQAVLPFGLPAIDRLLPEGGIMHGGLHEVAGIGCAAAHAAAATLFAASIMARTEGMILWCQRYSDLFAPGLAQVGLNASRILFVDAGNETTLLACMEEGLRHGGLVAVVGELAKFSMTASRRLQLAAETTGTLGFIIRRCWRKEQEAELHNATASHTRWRVTALPSAPLPVAGIGREGWHLELLRCRSGEAAQLTVETADETGRISLPADVADRSPAPPARSRRATT